MTTAIWCHDILCFVNDENYDAAVDRFGRYVDNVCVDDDGDGGDGGGDRCDGDGGDDDDNLAASVDGDDVDADQRDNIGYGTDEGIFVVYLSLFRYYLFAPNA